MPKAARPSLKKPEFAVKRTEETVQPVAEAPAREMRQVVKDNRKGQLIRLHHDAWKQLRRLALEKECAVHDLLIEAVNEIFMKHGLEPIARTEDRRYKS